MELGHNYEDAKMTGNPRRVGHHQGLLRAYKRKYGSLWDKPNGFRKAFQIMAADRRRARDKAWYAHPARARKTELESQSQSRHQPQSQQPDIDQGLALLDRAREALLSGRDKIKAILRQGSSEECKEALEAVERSATMLLVDFEEPATSLIAQLPRNNSQPSSLRKQCDEAFAKKSRYLARCRATLEAEGRLEDVEPEQ